MLFFKKNIIKLCGFICFRLFKDKEIPIENKEIPIEEHHKQWIAIADEGQYIEAIALCLNTIEIPEENFLASSFLGYAYFQIKSYELSVGYLDCAVKMYPNDYYSTFFYSRSLQAIGKKNKALAEFIKCCENNPNQAQAIFELALPLALEIEDSPESLNFFNQSKLWASNNLLTPTMEMKVLFFQNCDEELQEKINNRIHSEFATVSFRRIYSLADWASKSCCIFHALGEAEPIRIVTPPVSDEIDCNETVVYSNIPYVAEIFDALITSGSSLILVDNDAVLSDLLSDKQYGHFASLEFDKTVVAQRSDALLVQNIQFNEWISIGIMLSGLASEHYGHWFAEFLPKLRHFERHPKFPEIPIIIDEGMPASHYDFLRALVANPLYILSKGSSLKIGTLLVAPTTTFFPVELFRNHTVPAEHQASWTLSALRYIGEKIKYHYGEANIASDRIFLSRKNSSWRRLVNEGEVIGELQSLGFRVVFLEEHSFEEQVRIFQMAEFIIAPNGSALNNLIFSNINIKVLILLQKNPHNWGGWLGPMMDLDYKPVFLQGTPTGDENNKHSDYAISLEKMCVKVLTML